MTARRRARGAGVAAAALLGSALVAATASSAAPPAASGTTTIALRVVGCDDCTVQAVQNRSSGELTYRGAVVPVSDGRVELSVPTRRTRQMAFLVTAPYDEVVQGGFALAAVVGFRDAQPGSKVSARFARGRHPVSGCWAGTDRPRVEDVLVVGRLRQRSELIGPGRLTVASAYLRTSLPTLPPYLTVRGASAHFSDPSICS